MPSSLYIFTDIIVLCNLSTGKEMLSITVVGFLYTLGLISPGNNSLRLTAVSGKLLLAATAICGWLLRLSAAWG
jgi:hypothetical protein